MKVNVAQYFMHDLANRFPMHNEKIIDNEVIDVLIDHWSKRRYVVPNAAVKINHRTPEHKSYLM